MANAKKNVALAETVLKKGLNFTCFENYAQGYPKSLYCWAFLTKHVVKNCRYKRCSSWRENPVNFFF
jgi:hypothetical protein